MDPCTVDLTRTDIYPDDIPDADVETCLKVLRSIRGQALGPSWFDAHTALLMSHAHAKIHDLVKLYKEQQNAEGDPAEADQQPDGHGEGYDPDLAI
jgi:hypothetical protein